MQIKLFHKMFAHIVNRKIHFFRSILVFSLTFVSIFTGQQPAAAAAVPVLGITAKCDTAANGTFVISNTGANMTSPGTWSLTLNGTPIASNIFQLNAGASTNINTSGLFGTLLLSASGGGNIGSAVASTFCNPPTLTVSAKCDASGNGTFMITDIGAGMTGPGTWTLTFNGTPIATNSFQLNSGVSTNISTSGLLGQLVLSVSGGGSSGTVSASTTCPAQNTNQNTLWLPLIAH